MPPIGELPSRITFEDIAVTPEDETEPSETRRTPTSQGGAALDVIEWAASRFDVPIVLVGPVEDAAAAQAILATRGVSVEVETATGPLRAAWNP